MVYERIFSELLVYEKINCYSNAPLIWLSFVFLFNNFRAAGGMGILVKEDFDPERPQETNASFSLRNPREVLAFLSNLVSRGGTHKASTPRS